MEYDKSEDLLKKAIKADPKFEEAYETLGKIYLDQKKTDLALWAYQKALEIDPMRIYSRLELSQVWFDKQEYDKCLETLQPIREIQAQNKQILTQVDQLYANATFSRHAVKNPVPFNPINAG